MNFLYFLKFQHGKDPWITLKLLPFLSFVFFLNRFQYDAGSGLFNAPALQVILVASGLALFFAAVFRANEDPWMVVKLLPVPIVVLLLFAQLYSREPSGQLVYLTLGWPWYAPLGCLVMVLAALTVCQPVASDGGSAANRS